MRDLVVFLAAATIVLTLVLNGIPLPWLIRKLHAPSDAVGLPEEERRRAREIWRARAIAAVRAAAGRPARDDTRDFAAAADSPLPGQDHAARGRARRGRETAEDVSAARQLRLVGIAADRDRLYQLHDRNAINDETLRVIEEELDEREILSLASALRG